MAKRDANTKWNIAIGVLIGISVFGIPFLVAFILNLPFWEFSIGGEAAWVAFLGSYVGGVTGGLVAFAVARMQINQLRKESEAFHLRFYAAIESDFASLEMHVPSLHHDMKSGIHAYENKQKDDVVSPPRLNTQLRIYERRANAPSSSERKVQQVKDVQWNLTNLITNYEEFRKSTNSLKSFALSDVPPPIAFEFHELLRGLYRIDNQVEQFINYEEVLAASLNEDTDFTSTLLPSHLKVALADTKRISLGLKEHVDFLKMKIAEIRAAAPLERAKKR